MLALGVRAEAVPWREKGAIRFASSLPKRLIDSIMAQGNWNLLFQEGPFAEFQRQIAIANYFALRGESSDAEQYFKKAESALTIAYASLRGKYEWPRLPQGLVAKDLPWGENRETFQDFILCSLQLYLEAGLVAHESGRIEFEGLDSAIANAERQLSIPLRQKDADLHVFASLLQDAIKIRESRQLNALEKADRFDQTSRAVALSVKNYWSRRALLFRLLENIHHGNLSRALALTDQLYDKQADQLDPLFLARVYAATTAYSEAQKISEVALASNEQKLPENYSNYIRHSILLQNLHFLRRNYEPAQRSAEQGAEHLQSIAESGSVANEEKLNLRKSIRDQQLRASMFAYLRNQSCPDQREAGDVLEMEPEWRIKARLFFERCGLRHDRLWWQSIVTAPGVSLEVQAIAAYSEGRLTAKLASVSPQLRYLFSYQTLTAALARPAKKTALVSLINEYLQRAAAYPADFLFLDWGILLPEISDTDLAALLPLKADQKKATSMFLGLHRRYASVLTRGEPLHLFVAPDASQLSAYNAGALLDQTRDLPVSPALNLTPEQRLRYTGSDTEIIYDKATGEISQLKSPAEAEILFGMAEKATAGVAARRYTAPLYFWCDACGASGERTSRLLIDKKSSSPWQTTYSEIADTFSLSMVYKQDTDCKTDSAAANDTLIFDSETRTLLLQRCTLRVFNIVIDDSATASPSAQRAMLAMGWRKNLGVIVMPSAATGQLRSSLLFDFFQRKNRRDISSAVAFQESLARAEKSFSAEAAFRRIQFYASAD
jgi:hypothetical protein